MVHGTVELEDAEVRAEAGVLAAGVLTAGVLAVVAVVVLVMEATVVSKKKARLHW